MGGHYTGIPLQPQPGACDPKQVTGHMGPDSPSSLTLPFPLVIFPFALSPFYFVISPFPFLLPLRPHSFFFRCGLSASVTFSALWLVGLASSETVLVFWARTIS